jgi:hypothetical protein
MVVGAQRALSCSLVVLCVASAATASVAGAGGVVGPSQVIAGKRLSGWLGPSWRWRTRLRRDHVAPHERCISTAQRGPVWFLGADYASWGPHHRRVIDCTVPAGRYLMLDPVDIDCSTVERAPFHASSDRGLVGCARRWRSTINGSATATIDELPVSGGFLVGTPAFGFRMPVDDNMLFVTGRSHGRAAVVGLALLVRPLGRGHHTLTSRLKFRGHAADTAVYRITVR